jgi:hypothetical protein
MYYIKALVPYIKARVLQHVIDRALPRNSQKSRAY